MSDAAPGIPSSLLREVSRSFYLSLRLLPAQVRAQIAVAYLLARATDTIADTAVLPVADRLDALRRLRERILGCETSPLVLEGLAKNQANPGEGALLGRIEEVVAILDRFACFDRCCVREVLATITSGQELDLQRFQGAGSARILALQNDEELEDYLFRVAGCVGGFWTRLCRSHLYPEAPLDLPRYLDDAVRFGRGLQLVNILRDLPADLRQGRCYVPADGLQRAGLTPDDLLDPASEPRFRALYGGLLARAHEYLASGWRYTCLTPRRQVRVRIACALPILIGQDTLRLLEAENVLDATRRIKVPRRRVRALLAKTVFWHPFPSRWERLFAAG